MDTMVRENNWDMVDHELKEDGTCISCEEKALEMEFVMCRICKKKFHAVCSATTGGEKWATKSMILSFKAASTKRNFLFLCDECNIALDSNLGDCDGQRMRMMEKNMETITKELSAIKKLVSDTISPTSVDSNKIAPTAVSSSRMEKPGNIWNDTEKLSAVVAKPAESTLVITKGADATVDKSNTDLIENMVIENKIPVKRSFKDKTGNLHVVCTSVDSRDTLKNQVSAQNGNIEMKTPSENRPVVSIVGLTKNYEKDEVVDLLVKQNYFLTQFAQKNDVKDHIHVFLVKPLREKHDVFQAFARVSKVVREGFKTYKDKVLIGITTCKVYDQYHVKRCNNCQSFGHFYKDCPNPDVQVCAVCSGNHSTRDCTSHISKCVNCVKAEVPIAQCDHRADDAGCPTLRKQQEKMKKNLNLQN